MDDDMPQLIRIMPDYGPSYAHDEEGCVFDVTSYFEVHPNIEQIQQIESQLYGWASLLETRAMTEQPIPWQTIEDSALALTIELAAALGDIGIPIYYCSHYGNPLHAKQIIKDCSYSVEHTSAQGNTFVDGKYIRS